MSHENLIETEDWSYPVDYAFPNSEATTETIGPTPKRIKELIDEGNRPIRTIIAGSRTIDDREEIARAIGYAPSQWRGWIPSELVHGGAEGVDTVADSIVRQNSAWDVITTVRPLGKYGPRGPLLRNSDMVEYADNLIAVWNGTSNGTRDTIDKALDAGLSVYVHQV